ncbi:MAG: hypothetical protein KDI16_00010 [Halioglobus sp.]|nr:hypothetical protein [Halioglobus sp.]
METVPSTLANTVIGGVFAWLVFPKPVAEQRITLWGEQGFVTGIVFDLVPTIFMITFVTVFFVTCIGRRRLRGGRLAGSAAVPTVLQRAPQHLLLRMLAFGLLALTLFLPLTLAGLLLLGVHNMTFTPFLVFKLALSAAIAVTMTPLAVLALLSDDG